jgi:GAF domain-containing protein
LALVQPEEGPALTAEQSRLLAAVATQVAVLCERERLRLERLETDVLRRTDETEDGAVALGLARAAHTASIDHRGRGQPAGD